VLPSANSTVNDGEKSRPAGSPGSASPAVAAPLSPDQAAKRRNRAERRRRVRPQAAEARERLERARERLGGQVAREIGIARGAAQVVVDVADQPAVERRERRRVAPRGAQQRRLGVVVVARHRRKDAARGASVTGRRARLVRPDVEDAGCTIGGWPRSCGT
jgi:hypothetical protein